MKITNETIYKRLNQIYADIKILKNEETELLKEETKIELEEGKLMKLLDKEVDLQFDNIIEWKNYIWDTCPYKKALEKNKEIDFICKKTGNKCRFQDCFRNKKK
jgi:regulator of replication initiation timing